MEELTNKFILFLKFNNLYITYSNYLELYLNKSIYDVFKVIDYNYPILPNKGYLTSTKINAKLFLILDDWKNYVKNYFNIYN